MPVTEGTNPGFCFLIKVCGNRTGTICSSHVSLGTNYNFTESDAAKEAVLALLGHMWERPLQKVIPSVV